MLDKIIGAEQIREIIAKRDANIVRIFGKPDKITGALRDGTITVAAVTERAAFIHRHRVIIIATVAVTVSDTNPDEFAFECKAAFTGRGFFYCDISISIVREILSRFKLLAEALKISR